MVPTEQEDADVARLVAEAVRDRVPDEQPLISTVILIWPVWIGLPSKKSTLRSMHRPMVVAVTASRVLGLRVTPSVFPRGYADPGEIELDEPRDGLQVARSRIGPLASRADLVVPAKSVLIHARAQRQWRGRFGELLALLPAGARAGGETVLR